MTESATGDLGDRISTNLPFLRRYARALTGSQSSGDHFAVATLEAILADDAMVRGTTDIKTGLTQNAREALLLHSIEGFSPSDIAQIMQIEESEVAHLVAVARQEMQAAITGNVMIIEDEAIIAMDLRQIVFDLGHEVTGIARTKSEAISLVGRSKPDLIMADIQLADNSSGIDAVNEIMEQFDDIPVIFITAFPERLLTGTKPEPAFLITKPYSEDQVRSAVGQAMFFSSTETLAA